MKKKLLMITWRDIKSPFAGGAEILTHNILKRLTHIYDITVLSSAFLKCELKETIDGVNYIRLGNKRSYFAGAYNWKIYKEVFSYYRKYIHNKKQFDVVIEQINTIPFFYSLYANRNTILFIPQLCRKTWFRQLPWYLSWIGYYIFEPLSLLLLRNKKVITISESSKKDLMKFGFIEKNISIISMGISVEPAASISVLSKYPNFTVLSCGAMRSLKRTADQIQAFTLAKSVIPELRLVVAGSALGKYGSKIVESIMQSPYKKDIDYMGVVSDEQKKELMQKSHILLSTSVKEGWGLTITEAASQGTPALVYDVDGLRDSVQNGKTGIVCSKNTPVAMAKEIYNLSQNKEYYAVLRSNAWVASKLVVFDASAFDFNQAIVSFSDSRSAEEFLPMQKMGFMKRTLIR